MKVMSAFAARQQLWGGLSASSVQAVQERQEGSSADDVPPSTRSMPSPRKRQAAEEAVSYSVDVEGASSGYVHPNRYVASTLSLTEMN